MSAGTSIKPKSPKYQLPKSTELRLVTLIDAKPPSQLSLWERYRAFEYDALMVLDLLRRDNSSDRLIQSEWNAWLVRYKFGDLKGLPAIK